MMIIVALFSSLLFAAAAPKTSPTQKADGKLELIRKIPHSGYSEGIDYYNGFIWHTLPDAILKIDPKDGTILERYKPATDYSESPTWFKGKFYELSFSDNSISIGKIVNKKMVFTRAGTTPEIHGWGITHDNKSIIITGDYSPRLYFLNPSTLKVERTITTPVSALEDLAWDGDGIWASSYTEHRGQVFRINPKDGSIDQFFTLSDPEECPVIDGTAWDGKGLWVTGKHCPSIYLFKNPYKK